MDTDSAAIPGVPKGPGNDSVFNGAAARRGQMGTRWE